MIKSISYFLFVLYLCWYVSAYFCLRSEDGIQYDILQHELYTINNDTTYLLFNPCGTFEDYPTTNTLFQNSRKTIPLTDISTEVYTYQPNTITLQYSLKDIIPDCTEYKLQVNYNCEPNQQYPLIKRLQYCKNDPFFCSNQLIIETLDVCE
ncbi:Uncharacterized protein QTN25_005428 [Entamoeba marina]